MFWLLYLALPLYAGAQAASHVASKHGFLAGLGVLIAVMIVVLVPQTALLIWLNTVLDRRSNANPGKEPPGTAVESANVPMPEKTGARARFRQLIVYGEENGRQAATRLVYGLLLKMVAQHEVVEQENGDAGTSMVSSSELADGLTRLPSDDVLVVFRSHDKAWVGFRCGNDSFRFRHRAVGKVICTIIYPARGGGGYDITFEFRASRSDRPSEHRGRIARYELPFAIEAQHVNALTSAFGQIADMLNAKFVCQQHADV